MTYAQLLAAHEAHPGNPVTLVLSNGMHALVDADDYALVRQHRWHAKSSHGAYYAYRNLAKANGMRTTQRLHSFLTGWYLVDHRNGDGLDNRRSNLRPATRRENARNAATSGGRSRFKGVSAMTRWSRWRVQIRVDGGRLHVGCFADEEVAARAYDDAARLHFGEFAALNFPRPGERGAL